MTTASLALLSNGLLMLQVIVPLYNYVAVLTALSRSINGCSNDTTKKGLCHLHSEFTWTSACVVSH